jgi:hypothetical protein|tara:strand:+ start:915 stop:1181 length:267 start_codon:yes stop_codon:yes gene_type:complete
MNKKYFLLSLIFLASLSYDSFAGHFDNFNHLDEGHITECQACEENVDIQVTTSKVKDDYQKVSLKTNLTSRFVSFNKKSNLSRAPPLN